MTDGALIADGALIVARGTDPPTSTLQASKVPPAAHGYASQSAGPGAPTPARAPMPANDSDDDLTGTVMFAQRPQLPAALRRTILAGPFSGRLGLDSRHWQAGETGDPQGGGLERARGFMFSGGWGLCNAASALQSDRSTFDPSLLESDRFSQLLSQRPPSPPRQQLEIGSSQATPGPSARRWSAVTPEEKKVPVSGRGRGQSECGNDAKEEIPWLFGPVPPLMELAGLKPQALTYLAAATVARSTSPSPASTLAQSRESSVSSASFMPHCTLVSVHPQRAAARPSSEPPPIRWIGAPGTPATPALPARSAFHQSPRISTSPSPVFQSRTPFQFTSMPPTDSHRWSHSALPLPRNLSFSAVPSIRSRLPDSLNVTSWVSASPTTAAAQPTDACQDAAQGVEEAIQPPATSPLPSPASRPKRPEAKAKASAARSPKARPASRSPRKREEAAGTRPKLPGSNAEDFISGCDPGFDVETLAPSPLSLSESMPTPSAQSPGRWLWEAYEKVGNVGKAAPTDSMRRGPCIRQMKTSSPIAAATTANTDVEFAQLLAQQVQISQNMFHRHQAVVNFMRIEIEALRHELGDKALWIPSSLDKPGPVLAASPGWPTARDLSDKGGSIPYPGAHSDLEEALAVVASVDDLNSEDLAANPLRQQSSEARVSFSRSARRQMPGLTDDSEEVSRLYGRQRNSTRSLTGNMKAIVPGQVPQGMDTPTNRSSIVSDHGRMPSRQAAHKAALARASRARTDEQLRRNDSRTHTNEMPIPSHTASSFPSPEHAKAADAPSSEGADCLEPYENWNLVRKLQLEEEAKLEDTSFSALPCANLHLLLKAEMAGAADLDAEVWLVCSLALIAYDMILVPLSVYNLDMSGFEHPMTILSATFWTVDFILGFFVGYYASGKLEKRPCQTAANYAKTWMVPDLVLLMLPGRMKREQSKAIRGVDVASQSCANLTRTAAVRAVMASLTKPISAWHSRFEWIDAAVPDIPSLPSLIRSTRSFRILRFLKSAKLLRVAKMPGIFSYLPRFISRSEYITLSLGIVRHLLGILFINHVIASFWYLLGQEEGGWLEFYEIPVTDWWYSYLITLHWSLTQFTPASMHVTPHTLPERAFNVAVVIFALVTFSSFVSSITNLMTHLRNLESGERILFSKLEDFMQSRKFSSDLTKRVRRYLDQRLAEKRSQPEEGDIELLQRLSEPLRMEVHFEMHRPTLTKHPLFHAYWKTNKPAMMKLCHTALKTMQLSEHDFLFTQGEKAKSMYFVTSGCLLYTRVINGLKKEKKVKPHLGGYVTAENKPTFISEMVLWCPWSHCGSMQATTDCKTPGGKILCLDPSKLYDVVQQAKICQHEVCSYATEAVYAQSRKDEDGTTTFNRHNSAGMMGRAIRRGGSLQPQNPLRSESETDVSSEGSLYSLDEVKRIVEQENEMGLMDGGPKNSEKSEAEPVKAPVQSFLKELQVIGSAVSATLWKIEPSGSQESPRATWGAIFTLGEACRYLLYQHVKACLQL
eukprot:s2326_g4.t1